MIFHDYQIDTVLAIILQERLKLSTCSYELSISVYH